MGLLKGNALDWTSAVRESKSHLSSSFDDFVPEMKKDFDHPVQGWGWSERDLTKCLLSLQRGSRSAAEFSVKFRTIAADSGRNDEGICLDGHSDPVWDEFTAWDESANFSSLISLAIRLDNWQKHAKMEELIPYTHFKHLLADLVQCVLSMNEVEVSDWMSLNVVSVCMLAVNLVVCYFEFVHHKLCFYFSVCSVHRVALEKRACSRWPLPAEIKVNK